MAKSLSMVPAQSIVIERRVDSDIRCMAIANRQGGGVTHGQLRWCDSHCHPRQVKRPADTPRKSAEERNQRIHGVSFRGGGSDRNRTPAATLTPGAHQFA